MHGISSYIQQYDQNGKLRDFYRTRIKEPINEQRYTQPFKSGIFPFITPGIIQKYKNKTKIDTLFITEGEFKAFAADIHLGIDIIGIGGIHNFSEKGEFKLHSDIIAIIEVCEVKNVILLFDADCRTIDFEINSSKDYYKRLFSFYRAVEKFKELSKPLDFDLYFIHILDEYKNRAKGIDDLIIHNETNIDELKKEIIDNNVGDRKYTNFFKVSDKSSYKLQEHFFVDNVTTFYEQFKNKIKNDEFLYKGRKYFHNGNKLVVSWYGDALQYLRVGKDYYKKGFLKNSHNQEEEALFNWNIGNIRIDFGDKEFLKQLPKYDAFCNIPDNTENYKQVVEIEKKGLKTILYNKYSNLEHKPIQGSYENIEKFLKHIFNTTNLEGQNLYEFGLDWIQLVYTKPTIMLPAICLVSHARNTGKTTFLQLLNAIFKENMTILDNQRIQGTFTSHYITKLIIAVDETNIDFKNQIIKERIKNYITGPKQQNEAKGKDSQEVDFFAKIVLNSNNEYNFMEIEDVEDRFSVIKVNSLGENGNVRDPNLLEKMVKEIPHFIYFLLNRELQTKEKIDRLYFSPKTYITEAMKKVASRTRPLLHQKIDEFIREMFYDTNKVELNYTATDLMKILNDTSPFKTDTSKIRNYLDDFKNLKASKKSKGYILHTPFNDNIDSDMVDKPIYKTDSRTGKIFTFKIEDWLTKDEIEEINIL